MRCRSVGVATVLLLHALAPAQSQDGRMRDADLRAGTRVQLTMNTKERVRGSVVALAADSLVITPEGGLGTRSLRRADVVRVDLSAGRRSYKGRYARRGLKIGAAGGAVYGAILMREEGCTDLCTPVGIPVGMLAGGLAYGLVGGVVGALVGAPSRERWIRAPGDGGIPVSVGPSPGSRVAVRVSLRL